MSDFRQRFGPSIQQFGYRSGLMAATGRLAGPGGAIVLMYHSIAGKEDAQWIDPGNHVPADVFECQMQYLTVHRNVVSLACLVRWINEGRPVDDGTVVITFDDGYRDNLTVAAPVLARLGLPATLFLPTGYIDRGESQWIDQVYTAFRRRSVAILTWGTSGRRFQLEDRKERHEAYRTVCEELLVANSPDRRAMLATLIDSLAPRATPPRLTLTWDEVSALLDTCEMSIGGHSVEHTDLTTLSVIEAQKEIASCRSRIREMTGSEARHFSFCYGRTSAELQQSLPGLGIDASCAARPGDRVVTNNSDPRYLPRVAGPADMKRFEVAISTANRGLWRRLGR